MPEDARKSFTLWVEITEACQYKCRFCYNEWRSSPARLHRSMSLAVVPEVAALARRLSEEFEVSVVLAGGDASAHPHFVDIATTLAASAPVVIVTHGADIAPAMADRFAALGNVALQFSVPSHDEERYRFLTGGGRLDRVIEGALYASSAAIPLSISAVLTKVNVDDTGPMVHLARELEADYVIFNRFLPSGRGVHYEEQFAISQEVFAEALDEAVAVGRARGLKVYASGALPGVRNRKVASPKMTVSVDGKVSICSSAASILGPVQEDGDSLLGKYYAFWNSTDRLAGCFCSTL
ncbi:MAG TPA: radical SAM protein [Stellaceae bacterium]|nr:radical SAM protein [Stellaceae bacterium]